MAKAEPKSAETRVRCCGKWRDKGYEPSAKEKKAYAEKQAARKRTAKGSDKK